MKHMGMVKGYAFPVTQRIVDKGEREPSDTGTCGKSKCGRKPRRCVICGHAIIESRKTTYCSPACARVGKARRVAALRENAAQGSRGAA